MPESISKQTASHAKPPPGRRPPLLVRHAKWVFIGPAVIVMVLIMIYPLGYTLWMGFHEWFASSVVPPKFVGLDNYVRIFTDDARFWDAFWRTVYFTVLAISIQTVLGVGIALIFNRNFLGKGLVRTLFLFPMVATPVA